MTKQKEAMVDLKVDGILVRHVKVSTMAKNYAEVHNVLAKAHVSSAQFVDFEIGYLLAKDFMDALDPLVIAVREVEKRVSVKDLQKLIDGFVGELQ